jgi:hypothetical protein
MARWAGVRYSRRSIAEPIDRMSGLRRSGPVSLIGEGAKRISARDDPTGAKANKPTGPG